VNKASRHVLDASALLCLIFSEPGADRVEAVMTGAAVSAVNYAEVVSKLVDRGVPTDEVAADLADLDVEIVPLDRDLAVMAGRLRARTRSAGLSLGDRCCLALAGRLNAPAVTTDRVWESLGDALGIAIVMVR